MISQKAVDDSVENLGRLVIQKRIEASLTQEQFATKAGVSSHTLLDFETGRGGGISFRNLMQILCAAGIDANIGASASPIDYVEMYLSPWNESDRNRIPLRVGDSPSRARARLEKKRRSIYGKGEVQTQVCQLSTEKLDTLLNGIIESKDCAFVHEAALMAWGLDNNLAPYGVDVLASKKAFDALKQGAAQQLEYMGNTYVEFLNDYAPVRVWLSIGEGVTFASGRLVDCERVGYRCLRPELVLEALPASPDFQYLLEQRAALAEVLYFDDMTDEQLMEFRSFVRSV
jgi:transcriptional regulator with XRE-family HTH domain